jgi:HEAT repeat protein
MAGSLWGITPRESIEALCRRLGTSAVVGECVALLGGADADPSIVAALAGPTAPRFLDAPEDQRYWLRVWGARGLLWALAAPGAPGVAPEVVDALVGGLADEHWRVREMALRVIARYQLDDAQPAIGPLLTDETPRVRTAAARALRVLTR